MLGNHDISSATPIPYTHHTPPYREYLREVDSTSTSIHEPVPTYNGRCISPITYADLRSQEWGASTSPSIPFAKSLQSMAPNTVCQDDAAAVQFIKYTLSLRITELSEVLGNVSRQTVYSWLKGEREPQSNNRARIADIYKIAWEWASLSDSPLGSAVREIGTDGSAILSRLLEEQLAFDELRRIFRSLSGAIKTEKTRRPTIREKWEKRGQRISIDQERKKDIDILSGKRFEME